MKKLLGKKSILFFSTMLLSLIIIEISFQITFKSGFFKNRAIESQNGKCTYNIYQNLYHQSENTLVEFCRDDNGFVKSQNSLDNQPTIYVCGGSTTETYIVPPRKRWPAFVGSLSGYKVVNDSASGRTFSECLRQVELYLLKFPKPQRILLLNNVNTLGKFALDNSTTKELNLRQNLNQKISQFYYSMFPGISTARGSGFFQKIIQKESKLNTEDRFVKNGKNNFKIDYTYAIGLDSNCCHYASTLNSRTSSKLFDWTSDKNIGAYIRFYEQELNKLQKVLDKFDFPRERILFGFETYSYVLGKSQFGDPMRLQLLNNSSASGKPYSPSESFSIVSKYDTAIRSKLLSAKWNYFDSQDFLTRPEYFYDAVHLTPLGSEAMARGVWNILQKSIL